MSSEAPNPFWNLLHVTLIPVCLRPVKQYDSASLVLQPCKSQDSQGEICYYFAMLHWPRLQVEETLRCVITQVFPHHQHKKTQMGQDASCTPYTASPCSMTIPTNSVWVRLPGIRLSSNLQCNYGCSDEPAHRKSHTSGKHVWDNTMLTTNTKLAVSGLCTQHEAWIWFGFYPYSWGF